MRVKAILKGGLHDGLVIEIENGQSGIKVLHPPIDEASVYRHFKDVEEAI